MYQIPYPFAELLTYHLSLLNLDHAQSTQKSIPGGDSKWPFDPLVGGELTLGRVT